MWNEEIKDYEIVKADPKPFLLSANNIAARFCGKQQASISVKTEPRIVVFCLCRAYFQFIYHSFCKSYPRSGRLYAIHMIF